MGHLENDGMTYLLLLGVIRVSGLGRLSQWFRSDNNSTGLAAAPHFKSSFQSASCLFTKKSLYKNTVLDEDLVSGTYLGVPQGTIVGSLMEEISLKLHP